MANGGTTGELKALYKRKSVQSPFVAISEFGGISGDTQAGYNCTLIYCTEN